MKAAYLALVLVMLAAGAVILTYWTQLAHLTGGILS